MYLNRDETFPLRLLRESQQIEQVSVSKTSCYDDYSERVLTFVEINCIFVYNVYNYPAPKAFKYCTDFYFIYCYMILKEMYRLH